MKTDTPVAIGAAAAAALSFADGGWLVTAALIAGAGLIGGGCAAFAVWRGRKELPGVKR